MTNPSPRLETPEVPVPVVLPEETLPVSVELNVIEAPVRTPGYGRFLRIGLAIPLLALSGWALLPLAVVPVSSVAVVNARVTGVRGYRTGQVSDLAVDVGDRVRIGQPLLNIAAASIPQAGNAVDLLKQKTDTEIQYAAMSAQIANAEKTLAGYTRDSSDFNARVVANKELQVKEAERELETARLALANAARAKRVEHAAAPTDTDTEISNIEAALVNARARYQENHPTIQGLLGQLAVAKRRRATASVPAPAVNTQGDAVAEAVAAREVQSRMTILERLKAELANLRSGYYMGPSNERPPMLAKADEAASELAKLRNQKLVLELQLQAIAAHSSPKTAGPGGQWKAPVSSPVDGVVWSREVAPGAVVREGDELVRLVEKKSVHVEAFIDRRFASQLAPGDRAIVNVANINRRFTGRVLSVDAPGQRKSESDMYAIALKAPHADQSHVVIQVDEADRTSISVGQTARVMFPGPESSPMARAYAWLSRL